MLWLHIFCLMGASMAAGSALAQVPYPSKSITLVVPFATGGSSDLITRLVARELSNLMNRQVVVDNRVGGGGVVGWSSVARSPADGYTLLATDLSFSIAPGLIPSLPIDARKGFQQISTATEVPHVLVVTASLPVTSVRDLIALAKARPGDLNFGSGGNGTNTHLGGELLKNIAGINMLHVPYKGAGAVLQDLVAGQVQVLISAMPTVLSYVKSGRLRALLITDDKRTAAMPDIPSVKDVNMPGMKMNFWLGYSAPAGTPQPIMERLNKEITAAVHAPDAKRRFGELGISSVGNSMADATRLLNDEIERWTAVIKAAGIKPQ